jgi:hypothetical protein
MRWYVNIAMMALLLVADGARAQDEETPRVYPIRDLRLPLEQYEDGAVKTQLRAGGAEVPPRGHVHGRDVLLEMFDPGGGTNVAVWAETCRYSRRYQTAGSDGPVRVEARGLKVTGRGFVWESGQERVIIKQDVRVVLQRDLAKTKGALRSILPKP